MSYQGEQCQHCYFWREIADIIDREDADYGHCHFSPPIPYEDNEGIKYQLRPKTSKYEWCGQFKPRIQSTEKS